MLMDSYFAAMKAVQQKIETTQKENILAAAKAIAGRLAKGGAWHLLDTGHMLMYEGVGRTGGLIAVKPVRISCAVENPVRFRDIPYRSARSYDSIAGFPEYVINQAFMVPEDVLMVGSVSGYQALPVGIAVKAREMGMLTVGITAVEYSRNMTSKHPSGKRLFEACEHVIDNCSNYGDTLVDVPGVGCGVCPSSGVGAAYIMWALQISVVEEMLSMGLKPGVYVSNHMPGAFDHNEEAVKQYQKLGY